MILADYYLYDEQATLIRLATRSGPVSFASSTVTVLLERIAAAEKRVEELEAKAAPRRVAQHIRNTGIYRCCARRNMCASLDTYPLFAMVVSVLFSNGYLKTTMSEASSNAGAHACSLPHTVNVANRECLKCSTAQMCKTIVFENKECTRDDCLDPMNSK
jgi:hypothetical protein